jgi:tetratricopeptide (TPR) repeat protein
MSPILPPARRHRLSLAILVVVAAVGSGVWWYFHQSDLVPQPPNVDLSAADPEVARAITAVLDEVRAHPRDAGRWGRLGMYLRAHEFHPESNVAFRTASELDPKDYRWPYLEGLMLVQIEPERGLERLRKAAEIAPGNRPEPRLRLALLLFERGDSDEACNLAEAVLRSDPGNGHGHMILARAAAARGDWNAVIERAGLAAADPPCRRQATLLRGEAHAARGEKELADREFRAAADLPPVPDRPDPAVKEVEDLAVGMKARLATATRMLAAGRARDALILIDEVVRAYPNSPEPALFLGQVLIEMRDPVAARGVLEPFVVKFPQSAEGWFKLGVARHLMRDTLAAVEAFRQAVKLKPDHALAHFNLGQCYRELKLRPAAKTAFEEALRCRPDHTPSREALAELDKEM